MDGVASSSGMAPTALEATSSKMSMGSPSGCVQVPGWRAASTAPPTRSSSRSSPVKRPPHNLESLLPDLPCTLSSDVRSTREGASKVVTLGTAARRWLHDGAGYGALRPDLCPDGRRRGRRAGRQPGLVREILFARMSSACLISFLVLVHAVFVLLLGLALLGACPCPSIGNGLDATMALLNHSMSAPLTHAGHHTGARPWRSTQPPSTSSQPQRWHAGRFDQVGSSL